jgi:hypothetical protein
MVELPDCRAVWSLLEIRNSVTLDDLKMIAETEPKNSSEYLNLLIRQGYVKMAGVRKAAGGESLPIFKLIRRTGPKAPYETEKGLFVDPNVPIRGTAKKWAMPSLGALCRLLAERIERPFTRKELSSRVSEFWPQVTSREFNSAWYHLMTAKEIVEQSGGTWVFVPNEQVNALREHFRTNLGQTIISRDLRRLFPDARHHYTYRQALDLLAAEGFSVQLDIRGDSNLTKYRVDPADSPQEAVA